MNKEADIDNMEVMAQKLRLDLSDLRAEFQMQTQEVRKNDQDETRAAKQLQYAQSKIAYLLSKVEEFAKGQAVYIGHKTDKID